MHKKLIIFIFFLFFLKTISITVYHCSNMDLQNDQCMLNYTDKNGDTHILLKICPDNKICQPSKDYSMGFCVFNVRQLTPRSKCFYTAQCSTRICDEVCLGYGEDKYCNPEKMECDNNMTCRKTFEDNRYVYKCLNISGEGEKCDNSNECGLNLVCGYNKNIISIIPYLDIKKINLKDIKNYFNSSEYLNLTQNKFCIKRASLKNGTITNEEMACKSGQLIPIELYNGEIGYICGSKNKIIKDCDKNYKCTIEVDIGLSEKIELEQDCLFSNIGNLICPLNQKENAWKNYLNVYNNIYSKEIEKKIHIPYDKYTLQDGKVVEAYWEYFDWIHSIEGDECSKNYFFIKNKSQMFSYNLYYLLGIIFLFILLI